MPVASTVHPEIGCYIDLYEQPGFEGNLRRLYGPALYRGMRRRAGVSWGVPVESICAGERAYVMCFDERNIDRAVYWLLPGERVEVWSVSMLSKEIDSFRLISRPPVQGELGYEAYVKQRKQSSK